LTSGAGWLTAGRRWRRRRMGMTTVGPDTTRTAPNSHAVRPVRSVTSVIVIEPMIQVVRTPTVTSRVMTPCHALTRRILSWRPPSKSGRPTASETLRKSSSPNSSSGFKMSVAGPATKPAASSISTLGRRSYVASTWAPNPTNHNRAQPQDNFCFGQWIFLRRMSWASVPKTSTRMLDETGESWRPDNLTPSR